MAASLLRLDGESDLAYHRRLVYGKLIDKTLADIDYTELAPLLYGQEYSADFARRMTYGSCKTLQIMDAQREHDAATASSSHAETQEPEDKDKNPAVSDIMNDLYMQRLEISKERQRLFDQRVALNKLVRERARQEELNEIIGRAVQSGSQPSLRYNPDDADDVESSDNDLMVSLNDIHYGANVQNYWCTYNPEVCAAMMSRYLNRIIQIARTHHSENCIVWANGDMISGNIHYQIAVSNRENLIEQVMGVSELIAQFLAALSPHFKMVAFVSVAGNHSRIDQKDRALMDERLDDLVGWYLKARMHELPNVDVEFGDRIDASMYVMNVRGNNYVGVHGDYDPSSANIQALQTMVGKPVYAVLLGHKHHNCADIVQGIRTVMAGSFLGMDEYCVQKRIYGKPEQMVLVCDETGIRCSYDIDLS